MGIGPEKAARFVQVLETIAGMPGIVRDRAVTVRDSNQLNYVPNRVFYDLP